METNLSQSSCEIITELRNLEVQNKEEKCDVTGEEIQKLEVSPTELLKLPVKNDDSAPPNLTTEEETDSSGTSSSSSETCESGELVVKRKRKRKRNRKKKTTTAFEEPRRSFKDRYKKFKISDLVTVPKLHIRFDDDGDLDVVTSEYNMKPRIIRALERNLLINETLKQKVIVSEVSTIKESRTQDINVSLKPRIIKAIII